MEPKSIREPRRPKDYLYLLFSGVTMGAADVVPGVSGGTLALIMGVYETLVNAIKSVNLSWLLCLIERRWRDAAVLISLRFLIPLGAGIVLAFALLAHLVTYLLQHQPVLTFAFFFGLIMASILAIGWSIRWGLARVSILAAGTLLAYWVIGLVPMEMSHDAVSLFLSGAVAITAMILPGISGSFILLILGQYSYVLDCVKAFDVLRLFPFILGMIVGITSFSRVLSWLLKRHHDMTIAMLTGFMLGSLRKIWPFKLTIETMIDRHGDVLPIVQRNIIPDAFTAEVGGSLGLCMLGFVLIMVLNHFKVKREAMEQPSDI